MNNNHSVAILGAGVTGLSIAWALKKQDYNIHIYEKRVQPGGKIRSLRENGWLVEEGPNTMQVRDQQIWELLDELNLDHRIIEAGSRAKKRYIVRGGQPRPLPMGLLDFLQSDLISFRAKLRLLKEPFIARSQKKDESVAHFIRRRLGPEPLDYGVNPFVSGVYAGDPKKLSLKHTFTSLFDMERTHGSISKGFFKRGKKKTAKRALISFDEGLQILPQTISEKLMPSLHLNAEVQQMIPSGNEWEIHLRKEDEILVKEHQTVISTLPTHVLADVWHGKTAAPLFKKISAIEYAPVSVLALGFRREQIQHPLDGFGMLIPEKESSSLLGCLFSSSLFPKRAPENHALLTCFIGGMRNPDWATKSTENIKKEILPQLNTLLDVDGQPVFQQHIFWQQAIPQYTMGYEDHLQAMAEIESTHPGLFLAGNYRGGVSVPDCILNGLEKAEKVNNFINNE
ncbi:MAG TPA: protoporphyrinogen oxidase [Balneolaceae bacterium]|nr:protoporphyrinogen oxidase [Balneolaceae bacterium]